MTDYTKLVEALRCCIQNPPETCVGCTYNIGNNECNVKRMIGDATAAIEALQAQLPKRGEWIYHPKDAIEMMFTLPKCSICGHESSDALNYCPNCGAKMTEVHG